MTTAVRLQRRCRRLAIWQRSRASLFVRAGVAGNF